MDDLHSCLTRGAGVHRQTPNKPRCLLLVLDHLFSSDGESRDSPGRNDRCSAEHKSRREAA
jgi:hypothetical protein